MSAATIGSDWIGRIIDGRITLLRWLGGAGAGGVFFAQFGEPPENAAVKLIPADTANAESLLAQWRATTRLSHPHLMRLFHAGRSCVDASDLLYAVTEYSEEILSEILPARPLTPVEVREMLDPILVALIWLHEQGLVHGGLKPSNIMVVNDRLKLSVDRVQPAGVRISPSASQDIHDAPESAGKINAQADVWSLGVLLVEALTQQQPQWDGTRAAEPVIPASIPEPFATIARQCLRVDAARRCTLAEVKSLLDPSAVSVPAPAPPAISESERPAVIAEPPASVPAAPSVNIEPKPSVNRRATIAILVALLLIAAAVGIIVTTHHSSPSPSQSARPSPTTSSPAPAPAIRGHVRVSVRVQVDSSGNVSDADFESRGPSHYFANLALNAARNWKFRPAQANGRDVPSTWLLHFAFGQTGTDITPVETAP
jgi:TonB family protein